MSLVRFSYLRRSVAGSMPSNGVPDPAFTMGKVFLRPLLQQGSYPSHIVQVTSMRQRLRGLNSSQQPHVSFASYVFPERHYNIQLDIQATLRFTPKQRIPLFNKAENIDERTWSDRSSDIIFHENIRPCHDIQKHTKGREGIGVPSAGNQAAVTGIPREISHL